MRFQPILLALALTSACGPSSEREVGALPAADPALAETRLIVARHSPDGRRIVGLAPAEPPGESPYDRCHLVVCDADGANEVRLGQATFQAWRRPGAAWSPDGRSLAVVEESRQGSRSLKLYASDGTSVRTLAQFPGGELLSTAPVWSPDGRWVGLADVSGGTGPNSARVRLWEVDGEGTFERSVADERFGEASIGFSPDGGAVVLLARQALHVFDWGPEDPLPPEEPVARFDLEPWTSTSSREPGFLDDGRHVLCVAGDGLWIVDLELSTVTRILPDSEVIDAVAMPDGDAILAVVEERVEPNAVVGAAETLATVGHPPDRYARTAWRVPLDGSAPERVPGTRAVSQRHSFEFELGLAPSVRQALSRWR